MDLRAHRRRRGSSHGHHHRHAPRRCQGAPQHRRRGHVDAALSARGRRRRRGARAGRRGRCVPGHGDALSLRRCGPISRLRRAVQRDGAPRPGVPPVALGAGHRPRSAPPVAVLGQPRHDVFPRPVLPRPSRLRPRRGHRRAHRGGPLRDEHRGVHARAGATRRGRAAPLHGPHRRRRHAGVDGTARAIERPSRVGRRRRVARRAGRSRRRSIGGAGRARCERPARGDLGAGLGGHARLRRRQRGRALPLERRRRAVPGPRGAHHRAALRRRALSRLHEPVSRAGAGPLRAGRGRGLRRHARRRVAVHVPHQRAERRPRGPNEPRGTELVPGLRRRGAGARPERLDAGLRRVAPLRRAAVRWERCAEAARAVSAGVARGGAHGDGARAPRRRFRAAHALGMAARGADGTGCRR